MAFAFGSRIHYIRQNQVQPVHWDCQRILWRETSGEPIVEFWLTFVTYGMASLPYNAVITVNQCAIDHESQYPHAAKVVLNDFYVDDLSASSDTALQLNQLKAQLLALLAHGGFELLK